MVAYHPSLNDRSITDEIEHLKKNWTVDRSIQGWVVPPEHSSRIVIGNLKLWMRYTEQGALIELRRFDEKKPERRGKELTGGLVPSKRSTAFRWAQEIGEGHGLGVTLLDDEGEPRPDLICIIVERFNVEFDTPQPTDDWVKDWM